MECMMYITHQQPIYEHVQHDNTIQEYTRYEPASRRNAQVRSYPPTRCHYHQELEETRLCSA